MRTLTATEVARNFSRVLDSIERGGEEVIVVRNHQPVARILPGAPRMTALEALSGLHRTLDFDDGETWIEDMQIFDHKLTCQTVDPWE